LTVSYNQISSPYNAERFDRKAILVLSGEDTGRLLALGIQFIHFTEEYIAGFNSKFPLLFDAPEYPIDNFVAFNMFAYFMFTLGAIMIFKKIKPPMIIPLFFVMYGIAGNAVAHVIFCIIVGGYFPGIYSALMYWIIGPIIIKRIWNETRSDAKHLLP